MDRGAWWATAHGVAKESDTTERLNNGCVILLKVVSALFPSLSLSWPWVQSLVRELRSHKLCDGAKRIK